MRLPCCLMPLAVRHQQEDLALQEHKLVERAPWMPAPPSCATMWTWPSSTVKPLYEESGDAALRKQQALRLLGTLDYGTDGYFFVYDMAGNVLMHSRQPGADPAWSRRTRN